MATVTKGGTLPDTGVTKAEVYALVDSATVTGIVNDDVAGAAAIAATKLNLTGIDSDMTYAATHHPKRTIILTAAGATVPGTNGAEQAQTDGTNVSYWTLNFSGSADEKAFWVFVMPDSFDDDDITATVYYKPADGSTAGDTVQFEISFHDVGANLAEAVDAAPGTATEIDDVILNATPNDELHATPATTVSAANFADAGEMVICKLLRDISDDNMAEDAKVFAVKLEWGKDQDTD